MKDGKKDRSTISRDDVSELDTAAKTISRKTGKTVSREDVSNAIRDLGNNRKVIYSHFGVEVKRK